MPGWRSNRAPSRLKTSLQNKRRENAHYKEQSMKLPIFLLLTTLLPFTALTLHADDEGQETRPIVCIESKKIQNKTDNPRANFSALVDRLNHELTQSGIYRVMDMKDLAAVHVDTEKFAVAADDGGNQTKIQTPGFFVRMTILRYGVSSEKQQDALYGHVSGNEVATIELILTLVDMKTATTVASKNIKRTAMASVSVAPGGTKSGNYREQSLQEACSYTCQDIVKELIRYTPFYVMDCSGNNVMINAPASVAPVGSMFDIFETGKPIRNRRTGKTTRRETRICTIRITRPGEDGSYGTIVQAFSKKPVKVDYIARPAMEAPPAAAPAAVQAPSAAAPF